MQKRKSSNIITLALLATSLVASGTMKAAIPNTFGAGAASVAAVATVAVGGEVLAQMQGDWKHMGMFCAVDFAKKRRIDCLRYGSRAIALVMSAGIVVKALR